MSLKDKILTNDTSRKMIEYISPIYDSAHIGLWLHEVIGREYHELKQIVADLPGELNPETATDLLPFWEQRYD